MQASPMALSPIVRFRDLPGFSQPVDSVSYFGVFQTILALSVCGLATLR
jgi:hypothetical protein